MSNVRPVKVTITTIMEIDWCIYKNVIFGGTENDSEI